MSERRGPQLHGRGCGPAAAIAEARTGPIRRERYVIKQHDVRLVIERYQHRVARPALEIRMQEVHGCTHTLESRSRTAGCDRDSPVGGSLLLHGQGQKVVLVVERPGPELVTITASVNHTESEFRDGSPSSLSCFAVDELTQRVGGQPRKQALKPSRLHEMAPPMFLVLGLWRLRGCTHQHCHRDISSLLHITA